MITSFEQHGDLAIPPVYSPYPTELPRTFPVGRKETPPLVTVSDLQAHLRLLGAFDELRKQVRSQPGLAETEPDSAWIIFLTRAVYRFEAWLSKVPKPSIVGIHDWMAPPLDVIMIWHSYLLNPRTYFEDAVRAERQSLVDLDSFSLVHLASLIDKDTLHPIPPSESRRAAFCDATSLPFDPPLVTTQEDTLLLQCPSCDSLLSLQWLNEHMSGYAQRSFRARCYVCQLEFDKEAIGVRKFCKDVISRRSDPKRLFLAGTLLDPQTGVPDASKAFKLNNKLLTAIDSISFKECTEPVALAKGFRWKISSVEQHLRMGVLGLRVAELTPSPPRLLRVLNCYRSAGPSSIELSGATLRQGSFIQKMVSMGWTSSTRFIEDREVAPLVRSLARYHAFLDLMSSGPATFFVPTLDIDLAWHTHQLKAHSYRVDTARLLGRTPDHDDKVEEGVLSNAYDITARAWKARFGVPYSLCGCSIDSESRLSKFASKIFSSSSEQSSTTVVNDPLNTRPDLLSTADTDADSTHPSEHNSTVVVGDTGADAKRRAKVAKDKKRRQDIQTDIEKGKKVDPWIKVQSERSKRENHDSAYMTVVPYWGIAPYPYGYYGRVSF